MVNLKDTSSFYSGIKESKLLVPKLPTLRIALFANLDSPQTYAEVKPVDRRVIELLRGSDVEVER